MPRKKAFHHRFSIKQLLLSIGIILVAIFIIFPRKKSSSTFSNTSKSAIINFQYNKSSVEFEIPLTNSKITKNKDKSTTYSTPEKNIEIKYTNIPNGLKEDIILNKIPTTNSFASSIKTKNADIYLNSENLPVFLDPITKKYLFHVQKPYAYDAKGNKTFAVSYQLKSNKPLPSKNNRQLPLLDRLIKLDQSLNYSLIVTVDSKWLFDISRAYPITIDPTVIHDTQTEFATGTLNRVADSGTGDTAPSLSSYYQELPTDANTVALYHMNESAGTTIADASGNGNTGTLGTGSSAPSLNISSILGTGINFDGINDYVDFGTSATIKPINYITVEAWVKFGSVAADNRFISDWHQTVSTDRWLFYFTSSNSSINWIVGNVNEAQTGTITYPVAANTWYHLAGTYNGTQVQLYVNGVLVGSAPLSGAMNPSASSSVRIGNQAEVSNYFNGLIDEVRISNIARSPEEIKASSARRPYSTYTSPVIDLGTSNYSWNSLSWTSAGVATGDGETLADTTGLVAQWNFNESSGATATVSAGSCGTACNGTLTNFANTSAQDVGTTPSGWTSNNRKWGTGALMFDGVDDYVSVSGSSPLNPQTEMSVSSWFKANSTTGASLLHKGDLSGAWQFNYSIGTTSLFGIYNGSAWNFSTASYSFIPGTWYNLVATYSSGKVVKIYLNGSQIGNSTQFTYALPNSPATALLIGTNPAGFGATKFSGTIDSTTIYSRVLTDTEILSNYQAGSLNFQTRVGNSTDPNDGTWSAWSPTTSETQILSLDSDATNWTWDSTATYFPNLKSNDSIIKYEGSGSLKLNLGVAQTDATTVGLWHLDESSYNGTTGEIIDSTGVNHGTANSTTTSVKGISNRGIRHQSGTIASVPNSSSLNITNNLTLEYWFKPDVNVQSMANSYPIAVFKRDLNVGGYGSHFNKSTGKVNFNWCWSGACDTASSTTVFTANNWYYYTATYDGSNAKVYINGILEGTTAVGSTMASGAAATLYLGSESFEGTIDEIRISNTVRTTEEIAESYRMGRDHYLTKSISSTDLSTKSSIPFYIAADRPGTYLSTSIGESAFVNYQPDANTVGLWHLDEGDVGSSGAPTAFIKDSSGNNNHGTPGIGTSFPTTTTGKLGKARSFSPAAATQTQYISTALANNSSASFSTGFSASAWIYPTAYDASHNTVIGQENGFLLAFNSLGASANHVYAGGSWVGPIVCPTIPLNQWTHYVLTYDGSNAKSYIDGQLCSSLAKTGSMASASLIYIGMRNVAGTKQPFHGTIDEPRLDNIARTPDEIRQAFESGLRTHPITIDFAANLDSGNLVVGSTDYSFTIDATRYGLRQKGSFIYPGEKIIIKENIGGTEYIAQGLVNSVTASTGAITVTGWDAGATFPSGGFTANASVFKWQREFWNITSPLDTHLDTSSNLTLRVTNGNEGRTVWLDDFKNTSGYLNTSIGSTFTSTIGNRYFQYRSLFSSSDPWVSPSLNLVNLENYRPLIPTLISPNIGDTTPFGPTFRFITTDLESDYLQYKIEICSNGSMTIGCETFDQTTSQVGWSGQDAQSGNAFGSGTTATFIYSGTLPQTNYHYWRVSAIDPAGSNSWSTTSSVYSFLSPRYPIAASNCVINQSNNNSTFTLSWTDNAIDEDGYEIQKSIDGGAYSVFSTSIAPNTTSLADNSITIGHSYSYKIAPYYSTGPTYSNWCTAGVTLKPNLGSFRLD